MIDYSIVMPVFNREDLTKQCLETLLPTLDGAGSGECIVVDNGSRPRTADVLAAFPWVRVIRNDRNLGFAAACNQGAREARGRLICHLNNDIVATPGWLARMIECMRDGVGVVGAKLLFPNGTIQHAGVVTAPTRFGPEGVVPFHIYYGEAGNVPPANVPADFAAVTGACLLTPRDLFLELGGFDELFWNGYEDVDYCFKVGARGLRVVYEPRAELTHFESQSGVQRKRRISHNLASLGRRWAARVVPDQNRHYAAIGIVRREVVNAGGRSMIVQPLPAVTIVVHGPAAADADALMAHLTIGRLSTSEVVWLAAGAAPSGAVVPAASGVEAVRRLTDARGDRYIAFLNTRTRLAADWFDALCDAVEFGGEVIASTVVPSDESLADVEPCAADARCTLLNLRQVPAAIRIEAFDTLDGALVDLTYRAGCRGLSVRAARSGATQIAPPQADLRFVEEYGEPHDDVRRPNVERMERMCQRTVPPAPFVSIVMLSWNAPQYTQLAVDSIAAHTPVAHEVIIVDNGSGPDTLAVLRALSGVRVLYNSANMGFAHGCNQGIAAARGTHVVLLNNDVVVTNRWLEPMLDVQVRNPRVGVSAPRSNRVAGHQRLDVTYETIDEMHALAGRRSTLLRDEYYTTDRAIGFCLCIAREVIDAVGGIDTRYGIGNFEDDDFCVRVRAAGYLIAVCEDSFIHHFGSASFAANGVDYAQTMERNWSIFSQRWGLPAVYPQAGYDIRAAIAAGFRRERDFVALPPAIPPPEPSASESLAVTETRYACAFLAVVDGEADWSRVGPVVGNYLKTLSFSDPVVFSIAACGQTDAATIGKRIERTIGKLGRTQAAIADIIVEDVSEVDAWLNALPAPTCWRIADDDRLDALPLTRDRSPSGLARAVESVRA